MTFSLFSIALAISAAPALAQQGAAEEQTTKAPAIARPDSPQVVNRVAATVNGRPITSSEVRARMMPYVRELMMSHHGQGEEMTALLLKAKKAVIDELLDRELVLSEFEMKGYMIPDQQIDEELNDRILRRFGGKRDEFLKMLRATRMSYSEYKETIRKELSVGAMRSQRYEQGIPPTPDELQQEYALSKREYRDMTQDKAVFDKIYIPFIADGSAGDSGVQYSTAVALAKQIKSGEISFEDAAKKYSNDVHAKDGGRWPATARMDMAADFAGILFAAQPGKVMGPLYDPSGFTIVRLNRLIDAPIPSLSDPAIKKLVDDAARRRKSEKRYREWVGRLKKQAVIRIYI